MNREEIVGALARGYCSPKNEKKVLDIDLIEGMADEVMKITHQTNVSCYKAGDGGL